MPSPLVIALAVSVVANVWLAVTRTAARRAARAEDERNYLTSRAAVHLLNGTVSGDPDVAEEQSYIRFQALAEKLAGDRPLVDRSRDEQVQIFLAARRQLVLDGHLTLDDAERKNRCDLDWIGADPRRAGIERTETELRLAIAQVTP